MNKKKYLLPVILLIMGLALSYCDSSDDGGSGGGGADFDATLYYLKTDLDGGALNTLYYTETETDSLLGNKTDYTEFSDSIKVLAGSSSNYSGNTLTDTGWDNAGTGWTAPTDATQLLVSIRVQADTFTADGDIQVGFASGDPSTNDYQSFTGRLAGCTGDNNGQNSSTFVGLIDVAYIGTGNPVKPYIITCEDTAAYDGNPHVTVTPILWIK